ncbi:MAG: flavin reductase family protein [Deltaproteobacteria bacterium]|nr:flavin reductase family protein [Deltaproteobacteria bacterium]
MKRSLGAKNILCPTPVLVVGSYDTEGRPNLMTAAWGGMACSKPPCATVSLRPATHSYHGIMAHKAYTLAVPHESQARMVDYLGLYSGRDHDKFADTGLTLVKSELVDAPYAAEFALVLECQLVHSFELGLHTMFVGEIKDVKADPAVLDQAGDLDPAKLLPLVFASGVRKYYALGRELGRSHSMGKTLA